MCHSGDSNSGEYMAWLRKSNLHLDLNLPRVCTKFRFVETIGLSTSRISNSFTRLNFLL